MTNEQPGVNPEQDQQPAQTPEVQQKTLADTTGQQGVEVLFRFINPDEDKPLRILANIDLTVNPGQTDAIKISEARTDQPAPEADLQRGEEPDDIREAKTTLETLQFLTRADVEKKEDWESIDQLEKTKRLSNANAKAIRELVNRAPDQARLLAESGNLDIAKEYYKKHPPEAAQQAAPEGDEEPAGGEPTEQPEQEEEPADEAEQPKGTDTEPAAERPTEIPDPVPVKEEAEQKGEQPEEEADEETPEEPYKGILPFVQKEWNDLTDEEKKGARRDLEKAGQEFGVPFPDDLPEDFSEMTDEDVEKYNQYLDAIANKLGYADRNDMRDKIEEQLPAAPLPEGAEQAGAPEGTEAVPPAPVEDLEKAQAEANDAKARLKRFLTSKQAKEFGEGAFVTAAVLLGLYISAELALLKAAGNLKGGS